MTRCTAGPGPTNTWGAFREPAVASPGVISPVTDHTWVIITVVNLCIREVCLPKSPYYLNYLNIQLINEVKTVWRSLLRYYFTRDL